jgi:hypothetical protein
MLPSNISNGAAGSQHRPAIAPHLRAQMSVAEPLSTAPTAHNLVAKSDRSCQYGTDQHLEEPQYTSAESGPRLASPPGQQNGFTEGDSLAAAPAHDSAASLWQSQNGHLQNGYARLQEHSSSATVERLSADALPVSLAAEPSQSSSAPSDGSTAAGVAKLTSLQGRRVRGIVFDTETTGEPLFRSCLDNLPDIL